MQLSSGSKSISSQREISRLFYQTHSINFFPPHVYTGSKKSTKSYVCCLITIKEKLRGQFSLLLKLVYQPNCSSISQQSHQAARNTIHRQRNDSNVTVVHEGIGHAPKPQAISSVCRQQFAIRELFGGYRRCMRAGISISQS